MILFVKQGCDKCQWVKSKLPEGLPIQILDVDTEEGLAELAFYQAIDWDLPLLVKVEDASIMPPKAEFIEGAISIIKALKVGC